LVDTLVGEANSDDSLEADLLCESRLLQEREQRLIMYNWDMWSA